MALEAGFVVAIVALTVASLWLIAGKYSANKKKKALKPPHPPSWPIVGHLPLLVKQFDQPLHRFLYSLSERYGPIFHLQLGVRPALVISSSDLVKECLSTNDKAFASRPNLSIGKNIGYQFKVFGLAPYGTYWRDVRKLIKFHLFSAQGLDSYTHIRKEEVSTLVRSLFHSWKQQSNGTVQIKKGLPDMIYNVMLRVVASKRFSKEHLSPEEFEEEQNFKNLMDEFGGAVGAFDILANYLPFLRYFEGQKRRVAMENLKNKIDVAMDKVLNDHREKKSKGKERDLVDVLISATDNDQLKSNCNDDVVKANSVGMITGTGTISASVEWGVASMLRNPEMMRKAQQELDMIVGRERVMEESDVPNLKYLQAVVKETLRLYPPGPMFSPHESTEDCTVAGYHIPAKTQMLVNVWALHRDPAVWERPTEFDPERFLKGGKEIDVKGRNFEYLPFGSGRRMCPAMPLSMSVVTYTLGRLLHSFDWFSPVGTNIDMMEVIGFTMYKKVPLEATIKPRLPLHLY